MIITEHFQLALLQQHNIKIDWAVPDNKLFCSMFAGQRGIACDHCRQITHTSGMCPFLANDNHQRSYGHTNDKFTSYSRTNTEGRHTFVTNVRKETFTG